MATPLGEVMPSNSGNMRACCSSSALQPHCSASVGTSGAADVLPSPGSSPYRNQEQRLIIQATSALHLVDIETLSDLEGSVSARKALNELLDQLIQPMAELSNAITHSHFSHVEAPRQLVSMHFSGQA